LQTIFTAGNPTLSLDTYTNEILKVLDLPMEIPAPASPCVSICALDADGTCLGCYRTGDEITDWFIADDTRKREILRNAEVRRSESSNIQLL
jgi:predicted Fe-S protein YdhL (DUF1289 family)